MLRYLVFMMSFKDIRLDIVLVFMFLEIIYVDNNTPMWMFK